MPLPSIPEGLLQPSDLTPFAADIPEAKAVEMIADALAMAALVAPCIVAEGFAFPEAAKAILRGAVLRWNEAGSGAFQSQTTGPYGAVVDTRQPRRGMFWPSEIEQLQKLCQGQSSGAFSISPGTGLSVTHAFACPAVTGGACLCGALLGQDAGFGIPTDECY